MYDGSGVHAAAAAGVVLAGGAVVDVVAVTGSPTDGATVVDAP